MPFRQTTPSLAALLTTSRCFDGFLPDTVLKAPHVPMDHVVMVLRE